MYSIWAAWAFALGELVLVLYLFRTRLIDSWEGRQGTGWLLPALVTAAGCLGVTGWLFWSGVLSKRPKVRWALAAGTGIAAGALGYATGGGRLLSGERRVLLALALAVAAGLSTHFLAPRVERLFARRRLWVPLSLFGAAVAVEIANQNLLVRLYPSFHLGLTLLAWLLIAGAACWFTPLERQKAVLGSMLATGLLLAAGVLALPGASQRLSSFDNYRLLLFESSPSVRHAVTLAARVAPPPPLDDCESSGQCVPEAKAGTQRQLTLDLRGRSLLLVSIDALRADHLGAYGYQRNTTPHLDALAQSATLFERAYAPTPHTSYSVTSLMTGKYMRPLLLQGTGGDSTTWAEFLRTYGYKTAAFYPPAIFFIDGGRFQSFQDSGLGFEYRKQEFAEGELRIQQVKDYLATLDQGAPAFVWVHLFGPHEPYEKHAGFDFGDRDIDRYDSEIAAADATVGELMKLMRAHDPKAAVVVTADHGEEFGEHGGRYHGTTVYEEQVRVPLLVQVPGAPPGPRRISIPVQTIDLLPTFLELLRIPVPPRIRGNSLSQWLQEVPGPEHEGFASSETDNQSLLALSKYRLVCQRKLGACSLFDIKADPGQTRDISHQELERFERMRRQQRELSASHGRFEATGLRKEGKGLPDPILRALAGDGDAAPDVAQLLDDADPEIRIQAAKSLFALAQPGTAPALTLALRRDEQQEVRNWAALALTRLGGGAPLTKELLQHPDASWRRLSALALAETGDKAGKQELLSWWMDGEARTFEESRELLAAFAKIREKAAVYPLIQSLNDVRLRPEIAHTLGIIGDKAAVGPLLNALAEERYQNARVALADALANLGAGPLLAAPLTRFLGTPDPLPGGLGLALRAGILEHVGGPGAKDFARLKREATLGAVVQLTVPRVKAEMGPVRLILRARASGEEGWLRVSRAEGALRVNRDGKLERSRNLPTVDTDRYVEVRLPKNAEFVEIAETLPQSFDAAPGRLVPLVVLASSQVELDALALVPLSEELPPPPPKDPGIASEGGVARGQPE